VTCPVCRDPLGDSGVAVCPTCETPVHAACQEYAGGCVRFACVEASTPRQRLATCLESRATVAMAWWTSTLCVLGGLIVPIAFALVVHRIAPPLTVVAIFAALLSAPTVGLLRAMLARRRARRGEVTRAELTDLLDRFAPPIAGPLPHPVDTKARVNVRLIAGVLVACAVICSYFPRATWINGVSFILHNTAVVLAFMAMHTRVVVNLDLRRRVGMFREELEQHRQAMLTAGESTLQLDAKPKR
jgi:hypothetical protein